MTKLTRRNFIKTASLMGGVSLFAGCSFFGDAPNVPKYIKGAPGVDPIESLYGVKNLFSVCAMCEGRCGICCRNAEGAIVKIGGSSFHPVSKGDPLPFPVNPEQAALIGASICAIGSSGIQTLYDPFRIARPLKRVGPRGSGKWKAVSWSEAISEITTGGDLFGEGKVAGLKATKDAGQGFGFLVGSADWGSLTFIKSFLKSFTGARLFRDGSVLAQDMVKSVNRSVFGDEFGSVHADYRNARFLLDFGSAPLDSGVPLLSIARDLTEARISRPSLKWAVVDPRQSTSAAKADIWAPIMPGKDLSFALAIIKALYERFPQAVRANNEAIKNAVKNHSVSEYSENAGSYEGAALEIAKLMVEAGQQTAVIPGSGVYRQQFGKEAAEAILSLNLMVGSTPGNGGLTFDDDSFFVEAEKSILGMVEPRISDPAPLAPGYSLIMWGADPVYANPKMASLLSNQKEFPLVVAIGTVISQTASMADFILPDTTYLERWDICGAPSVSPSAGFGLRAPAVGAVDARSGRYFPILPETMLMEDILYKFSESLGMNFGKEYVSAESPSIAKTFYYKTTADLFGSFSQSHLVKNVDLVTVEKMFERGGYFQQSNLPAKTRNTQAGYKANPARWDGRVQFNVGSNNGFLTLITYSLPFHRSPESGLNSWLLETMPENRLIINPIDASSRGLKQGESISVESSDGSVKRPVRIQIAPGIRPGVVALANGYGYTGAGATPYSIDNTNNFFDKPRSAGVNPSEFLEKGPLVFIRKA